MQKTHREMYPGQYTHPLCGKLVKLKGSLGKGFRVERVVSSRFGLLAIPEGGDGKTAYAVHQCVPAD